MLLLRRWESGMLETVRTGGLEMRFFQTKDTTDGSLDLFEMTLLPNAHMPVAHHHESWDETVQGLEGTTTWIVDGVERTLHPGESLFIKRGVVHAFRNDTRETAKVLSVLTPGVLGIQYFRDMAELLAVTPPEWEKMKALMLRNGLIPQP
jgi:quercetin dioxygenase-like cupin family protein